MKDLPRELWHKSYIRQGKKKTGGPNLRLLRLDPQKPSNTITAFVFNKFVHPFEDRYITPREAARIQGFPDNFTFSGPVTKTQLQIGNAVPVRLAAAVASWVSTYLEKHGIGKNPKAVSLFSGAGGMDLGFSESCSVVSANEYDPVFCETLRRNLKNTHVVEGNISKLSGLELARGKKIDIVFGGPPCQAFSAAGKQKGLNDPRGSMIEQYVRLVRELKPEVFVLENVPNLKAIDGGRVLAHTLALIDQAGYAAEWYILNAADYGAPQARRRLFILGRKKKYRDPLGKPLPTHSDQPSIFGLKPYVTVADALQGLPAATIRDNGTVLIESVAEAVAG